MTRANDLAAWLLANVTYFDANGDPAAIRSCAVESSLDTTVLPGCVIGYEQDLPADVMDATQHYERYSVALVADRTGANVEQMERQIAQMEASLQQASRTAPRFSDRWTHFAASFVNAARPMGASVWQVDLLVSGL